jgi:hypothetical protein
MQKGSKEGQPKGKQEKAVLEAGFSNYFSGANRERALQKDKELRDRSRSKNAPKKSDEKLRRGWHDRGPIGYDNHPRSEARMSADRYSQHSEDEEADPHNKVGLPRSIVGTKESGQNQSTGTPSTAKENT